MKRHATRHWTSWITALAMFVSAVMPLHAFGHVMRSAGPGSDFCSTAKSNSPSPNAPATSVERCASCCPSTGNGPALLSAPAASVLVAAAVLPHVHQLAVRATAARTDANARAPPLSA